MLEWSIFIILSLKGVSRDHYLVTTQLYKLYRQYILIKFIHTRFISNKTNEFERTHDLIVIGRPILASFVISYTEALLLAAIVYNTESALRPTFSLVGIHNINFHLWSNYT